jgi:hypothetical protein
MAVHVIEPVDLAVAGRHELDHPAAECEAIRGVLSNDSQRRKSCSIYSAIPARTVSIPVSSTIRIIWSTLTKGTWLRFRRETICMAQ